MGRPEAETVRAGATETDGALIRTIATESDPAKRNAALTALLARHHQAMLRAAQGELKGRDVNGLEAEDVVQEVIAEVLLSTKLVRFDADRPFAPWVATVVRNRARGLLRGERTHLPLCEHATGCPAESAEPSAEDQVQQLLSQLPPKERTLLERFYLDDRSAGEVGSLLGMDARKVYRELHRLRRRIRAGADFEPR